MGLQGLSVWKRGLVCLGFRYGSLWSALGMLWPIPFRPIFHWSAFRLAPVNCSLLPSLAWSASPDIVKQCRQCVRQCLTLSGLPRQCKAECYKTDDISGQGLTYWTVENESWVKNRSLELAPRAKWAGAQMGLGPNRPWPKLARIHTNEEIDMPKASFGNVKTGHMQY